MKNIKIIAFDADDTLWINEPNYRNAENSLRNILQKYLPINHMGEEIYKIEAQNIELYGYGAKGFTLSMIETAIELTHGKISSSEIKEIIYFGKVLMDYPIKLLPNVIETITMLKPHYQLIMITKGDLIDQQRKIKKSNLADYFDHIEIVSEKDEKTYSDLIKKHNIQPEEFLMIGNSLRSDILPILKIGGKAIHLTGQSSWVHETTATTHESDVYHEIEDLCEIIDYLPKKGY